MTFTVNIEHSPLLKEIHDQGRVNGARRVCFELLRELGLDI